MSPRSDTPPTVEPPRPLGGAAPRLQVLSLAIAIVLPLWLAWIEPDRSVSTSENRRLATLPTIEWSASSLSSFPARMDAYFDDRMGLRLALIRAHARLHIDLLGRSPSSSLVVGRDGWLFFGDDRAVAQYRGLASLDDATLVAWQRSLEAQRDALVARAVAFLVVFAPNKHSIYPDRMPAHVTVVSPTQALSQLVDHLRAHSDVAVLDLRPVLREARERRPVYHRTDTHWNDAGAHVAYRAILEAVAAQLPGFVLRPPVEVEAQRETVPGMGLAQLVGLSARYPETITRLLPRTPQAAVTPEFRGRYAERVRRLEPFAMGVGDARLPRAVVFRDSFANALIPYLAESFQRVLFAWSREVDPRIVELERPDIVILEIAERFVGEPPVSRFDPEEGRGASGVR